MMLLNKWKQLFLYLMIILAGILPIVIYGILIPNVPTITPQEAMELLGKQASKVILVDIRTPEEFNDNHLNGAQNWPYSRIISISSRKDIPEEFENIRIVDTTIGSAEVEANQIKWAIYF